MHPEESDRSAPKFRAFEGLRGYMAWWVVVSHIVLLTEIGRIYPNALVTFLGSGDRPVRVFIILSGFVITHLRFKNGEPYGTYLRKRARRIYPIYLVALAFAIVTMPAWLHINTMSLANGNAAKYVNFQTVTHRLPVHILAHLTLLHGLLPDEVLPLGSISILGPAWSLSLEWQFYLVAPFLVSVMARSPKFQAAIIGASLTLSIAFGSGRLGAWEYPSMLLLALPLFLLGMLTRIHWQRMALTSRWQVVLLGVVIGIAAWPIKTQIWIWTVFVVAAMNEGTPNMWRSPIGRLLQTLTSNRLVRILGEASYSTYLIHIPVIALVVSIGCSLIGTNSRSGVAALATLAAAIVVPLSLFLYANVERRFITSGQTRAAVQIEAATPPQ
jgi:peptidoglycan/LPS O-acetylase OafA/YrhL